MKDSRIFFLLDLIDLESIPSLSQSLLLLPLPVLIFSFREESRIERWPWCQISLPWPFLTFLTVSDRIGMYEIAIKSKRYNRGNHSPKSTSFFQLESLMWLSLSSAL